MSHGADASPNAAPSSPELQATVQRAYGYAQDQGHRQVTPEHLLLALTEDADAIAVLQRRAIDLDRLRHDVAALMGRNNDRFAGGEPGRPDYGPDFRRVMGIAGVAASPRRPVDGALMISALIADGVTPSAEIIKLYGLTFEDAARTSRPLRSAPPAPPPAASPSLANVRSNAREAALGYRLRKGPPDDFVAMTASGPGPVTAAPRNFAEPTGQAAWPAQAAPPGAPAGDWDDAYTDLPLAAHQEPFAANRSPPAWQPAEAGPEADGQPDWSNFDYPEPETNRSPQPEETWADDPPAPPLRAPQRPAHKTDDHRSGESAAAPKTKGRKSPARARRSPRDNGLLLENIPRRMIKGTAMSIEARIARRDVEAAILDFWLPSHVQSPDLDVTHAITVRLRSPDGAMTVESGSPETQWVETTLGLLQDDFSSWRWTVTPRWTGVTQLQLVVSTRAVTPQGLLDETALPEQTVGVTVVSNYGSLLARMAKWVTIAMAAGIAGAVGEHLLKIVGRILTP